MKYLRLIIITTIVLFVIGFSSGSYLLKFTETIIGKKTVSVSVWESMTPNISFGLLLALCSLGAGAVLWAYLKNKFPYSPELVLGVSLFVSLSSALIGIGLKLWQLQRMFFAFELDLGEYRLTTSGINYFAWGYGMVLFTSGMIVILLLWIARLNKQGDNKLTAKTA